MVILDGKKTALETRRKLAAEIAEATARGIRPPGLAVIMVGADPASEIYVRNKRRACEEAGINSTVIHLDETDGEAELLGLIDKLNKTDVIDGILLQLPLPPGYDSRKCLLAVDPDKDVDGFHPLNMGRLALGLPGFQPCTPAGIIALLKRYGYSLDGKKAAVVGRSDIVGKPLALLLTQKEQNATVTICHSGTKDLKKELADADFVFLAMGKPRAIKAEDLPPGCVVVDVGINRTDDGLCGDADFDSVCEIAEAVTPVPGGVGPMTIAALLENTVKAWRRDVTRQTNQNDLYGKNAS